jgi:hypothetical protein
MSGVLDVILSARFVAATLIYTLLTLSVSWLDLWLEEKLHEVPVSDWLAEHFGIPLLRALSMIVFIILLYPELFQFEPLPSINQLLADGEGRIQHMVNWVFVIALLLPLIPVLGPRIEIVLPVQGLIVLVILSHWLIQYIGLEDVSLFPSASVFSAMMLTGVLGSYLTVVISQHLGRWIDRQFTVHHGATLIYPLLALVIQTPTLALYVQGVFNT